MNIFGQVWSCVIGDVVWEGTGEISVQTGDELTHIKQTVDELVNMAARSFLNNLPGLSIGLPITPKPPQKTVPKTKSSSHIPML